MLSTRYAIKSQRNGQLLVASFSIFILFLLVLTWGVVAFQIDSNQRNAVKNAESDMQSIAAAYEQFLLRTLRNYDTVTRFLKYEFESHNGKLDLDTIVDQGVLAEPDVVSLTLVDEHGNVVLSSLSGDPSKVNLRDREHFQVHAAGDSVDFFIGKPVIGRLSKRETVQMTRRLNHADGSFAGIIVVSENPAALTESFNTAHLRNDGYLSVRGMDGIYRAVHFGKRAIPAVSHTSENGQVFYTTPEDVLTGDDGKDIELISASHTIEKYNLIGTVGIPKQQVLATANQDNKRYYMWGALVSLLILLFYALALTLIRKLRARQREVEDIARRDTLTNLPNRLEFQRLLQDFLEKNEESKLGVGVLFIDLDNFKNINDSLGHDVGDTFLTAVASRLRAAIREGDCVCRFGGDEFTVILPDCSDQEVAEAAAKRILKTLQEPYTIQSKRLSSGASIGISLYPRDGLDSGTLIRHADLAMYKVKADGKNAYLTYSAKLSEEFNSKMALEQAIATGIERNEFFLEYQPKINMATRSVIGVEALLRWQCPDRGRVSPADFIPIAEETGLILPLSKIVMNAVCIQVKRWHEEGLGWIPTAINVSACQFSKGDLAHDVLEVLAANGVPPYSLEIEITESLVMKNLEGAAQTLRELKHLGVKISIDDFGTGHSSLNSLTRLPADFLKIDRSFIHNAHKDEQSAAVIRTIIALANNYKMQVIAEGVETVAQHEMLRTMDCDMAQGFLYSRPIAAEQVPGVIRRLAMPVPLRAAS